MIKKEQHMIDMCSGNLPGKILLFALPLAASRLLQLLFNAADIVVVGKFVGKEALAAVGSNTALINLLISIFVGLSIGTNVTLARAIGAKQPERVKAGARLGVAITVGFAELLGLVFFLGAPFFVGLFSPTPDVVAFGVRQARTESLFYCFLAFSHASAAVLRGAGKTVTPMVVLLSVWCLFRIGYITVMVALFQNIVVVFTAYPVTWSISSVLFALALRRGKWLEPAPIF